MRETKEKKREREREREKEKEIKKERMRERKKERKKKAEMEYCIPGSVVLFTSVYKFSISRESLLMNLSEYFLHYCLLRF